MIVEKRSRYFRLYEISTTPRSKKGVALPMTGDESLLSLFQEAARTGTAFVEQANEDSIELIKAELVNGGQHIALLFHRASPNAPEPIYRSRAAMGINLRPSEKEDGEEQAFSAHMIVEVEPRNPGRYRAVLEEVPGLSASAVVGVLRKISIDNDYECNDDRGRALRTYTVIKCDGYSSETLIESLRNGRINKIDLSKEAECGLEQDGAYVPSRQRVKLKVAEAITAQNWARRIQEILNISTARGYDDLRVTIDYNDKRSQTISVDRDAQAAEIMLVRSKKFLFEVDLDLCYVDLNDSITATGIRYISE